MATQKLPSRANLDMQDERIRNLPDLTESSPGSDAANKNYVDSLATITINENISISAWTLGSSPDETTIVFDALNAGDVAVGLESDHNKFLAVLGFDSLDGGDDADLNTRLTESPFTNTPVPTTQEVTFGYEENIITIASGTMISSSPVGNGSVIFPSRLFFSGTDADSNPTTGGDIQAVLTVPNPTFQAGSNIQLTVDPENNVVEIASTEADIEVVSSLPEEPNNLDLVILTADQRGTGNADNPQYPAGFYWYNGTQSDWIPITSPAPDFQEGVKILNKSGSIPAGIPNNSDSIDTDGFVSEINLEDTGLDLTYNTVQDEVQLVVDPSNLDSIVSSAATDDFIVRQGSSTLRTSRASLQGDLVTDTDVLRDTNNTIVTGLQVGNVQLPFASQATEDHSIPHNVITDDIILVNGTVVAVSNSNYYPRGGDLQYTSTDGGSVDFISATPTPKGTYIRIVDVDSTSESEFMIARIRHTYQAPFGHLHDATFVSVTDGFLASADSTEAASSEWNHNSVRVYELTHSDVDYQVQGGVITYPASLDVPGTDVNALITQGDIDAKVATKLSIPTTGAPTGSDTAVVTVDADGDVAFLDASEIGGPAGEADRYAFHTSQTTAFYETDVLYDTRANLANDAPLVAQTDNTNRTFWRGANVVVSNGSFDPVQAAAGSTTALIEAEQATPGNILTATGYFIVSGLTPYQLDLFTAASDSIDGQSRLVFHDPDISAVFITTVLPTANQLNRDGTALTSIPGGGTRVNPIKVQVINTIEDEGVRNYPIVTASTGATNVLDDVVGFEVVTPSADTDAFVQIGVLQDIQNISNRVESLTFEEESLRIDFEVVSWEAHDTDDDLAEVTFSTPELANAFVALMVDGYVGATANQTTDNTLTFFTTINGVQRFTVIPEGSTIRKPISVAGNVWIPIANLFPTGEDDTPTPLPAVLNSTYTISYSTTSRTSAPINGPVVFRGFEFETLPDGTQIAVPQSGPAAGGGGSIFISDTPGEDESVGNSIQILPAGTTTTTNIVLFEFSNATIMAPGTLPDTIGIGDLFATGNDIITEIPDTPHLITAIADDRTSFTVSPAFASAPIFSLSRVYQYFPATPASLTISEDTNIEGIVRAENYLFDDGTAVTSPFSGFNTIGSPSLDTPLVKWIDPTTLSWARDRSRYIEDTDEIAQTDDSLTDDFTGRVASISGGGTGARMSSDGALPDRIIAGSIVSNDALTEVPDNPVTIATIADNRRDLTFNGSLGITSAVNLSFYNIVEGRDFMAGSIDVTVDADFEGNVNIQGTLTGVELGGAGFTIVSSTSGETTVADDEIVLVDSNGKLFRNISGADIVVTNEAPASGSPFTNGAIWQEAGVDQILNQSAVPGLYVSAITKTPGSDISVLRSQLNFLGLADTPSAFTGNGGRIVRVNTGGTALEFVEASGSYTAGTGLSEVQNATAVDLTGTLDVTGRVILDSTLSVGNSGTMSGSEILYRRVKEVSKFDSVNPDVSSLSSAAIGTDNPVLIVQRSISSTIYYLGFNAGYTTETLYSSIGASIYTKTLR